MRGYVPPLSFWMLPERAPEPEREPEPEYNGPPGGDPYLLERMDRLRAEFQEEQLHKDFAAADTDGSGAIDRQAIRPLAAMSGSGDNQEEATRELYRRRRARGVATGPMGLTGQANVQRKTLLGS